MAHRITVDTVIKISLLPFGIHDNLNKYLERYYILFISLLSLTVGLCQIKNYSTLDSNLFIMDNTVYVGAMIFVINNFWISRIHKSLFLKILHRVRDDVKDEQFADITHTILKKYFLNVGIICTCLFSFMISLPILAAVATNEELGSTATLLFPCWFPWEINSQEIYIFTLMLQFGCGGILYSFSICSTMLVTCFMVVIKAHSEHFKIKVKEMQLREITISKKMAKMKGKMEKGFHAMQRELMIIDSHRCMRRSEDYNEVMSKEFRNISIHQQYIYR